MKMLTALLCQPLLSDPDSASFSRITINLPLRSVSCAYRIVDSPGAYSAISFLSDNHCIGSSLMEFSDDSSEPPELLCWRSTAEFLDQQAALADGSIDVLIYNAQTRGSIPDQLRAAASRIAPPMA